MQIQQRVLRLAAAAGVTVFMVMGPVGPVHATDTSSAGSSSQKATGNGQAKGASKTNNGKANHGKGNASTTGDASSPQPESTADQNDGGANAGTCPQSTDDTTTTQPADSDGTTTSADDSGSTSSTDATGSTDATTNNYCSTRDGSPSKNGNGGGKATGKPCAGCVGKADNKNPPGQYPDGSDANNGYECDGNNGIGKSNPAHTGCTSGSEEAGEEAEEPEKSESCPADEAMTDEMDEDCASAAPADDAAAPTEVLGVEASAPGANRPAAEVAPASSGLLPATGAGRYGIPIAAGVLLLGAGGVLLARKRPQTGR